MRKTQNAIKHALTERFYAWEDALQLAKKDPEIEFTKAGVNYTPGGQQRVEDELEWEDEEPGADEAAAKVEEKASETEAKPSHETVDPSIPPNDFKGQQDAPRA